MILLFLFDLALWDIGSWDPLFLSNICSFGIYLCLLCFFLLSDRSRFHLVFQKLISKVIKIDSFISFIWILCTPHNTPVYIIFHTSQKNLTTKSITHIVRKTYKISRIFLTLGPVCIRFIVKGLKKYLKRWEISTVFPPLKLKGILLIFGSLFTIIMHSCNIFVCQKPTLIWCSSPVLKYITMVF